MTKIRIYGTIFSQHIYLSKMVYKIKKKKGPGSASVEKYPKFVSNAG